MPASFTLGLISLLQHIIHGLDWEPGFLVPVGYFVVLDLPEEHMVENFDADDWDTSLANIGFQDDSSYRGAFESLFQYPGIHPSF